MKKSVLFITLTALLLVAGCSTTTGSLETTNLDPERPTLRFLWASGTGRLFESSDDFWDVLNEIGKDLFPTNNRVYPSRLRRTFSTLRESTLPLALDDANTTYTELFSAPIDLGQGFSSADETLKGTTWQETDFTTRDTIQKAFTSFTLQLPGYDRTIKQERFPLESDKWSCICIEGTNDVKLILVKLYEPQNNSPASGRAPQNTPPHGKQVIVLPLRASVSVDR